MGGWALSGTRSRERRAHSWLVWCAAARTAVYCGVQLHVMLLAGPPPIVQHLPLMYRARQWLMEVCPRRATPVSYMHHAGSSLLASGGGQSAGAVALHLRVCVCCWSGTGLLRPHRQQQAKGCRLGMSAASACFFGFTSRPVHFHALLYSNCELSIFTMPGQGVLPRLHDMLCIVALPKMQPAFVIQC